MHIQSFAGPAIDAGRPGANLIDGLGLTRVGKQWRGDCPACGYGSNAFTLSVNRDGSLHGWCASCQDQDAIEQTLAGNGAIAAQINPAVKAARQAKMQRLAKRLWINTAPASGTHAERYLTKRGLPWLAGSSALRFGMCTPRPKLPNAPAMIAMVVNIAGDFIAVHRTYVTALGTKAPGTPDKASLGPVWGGTIRLEAHDPNKPLVIGEGIESSASAGKLLKLPAWSAVSAGNLAKGLNLPEEVRSIIIAADPGEPGERAAAFAALRWRDEGREVSIARPDPGKGDFNDLLLSRGAR